MEPRKKTSTTIWVSNSQTSPSTKEQDWSLLPEELVLMISEKLEDCFDVIHFRSVCHPWRSIIPFPFWPGGISQDNSEDHMEHPSPLQCTVEVKIPGSEPTLLNVLDCQILPLGYHFRMVGWDRHSLTTDFGGVAFLPLDKDGGKEFVVLIGYGCDLLVLRSYEMRWMRLKKIPQCMDIVTFRGKFYVSCYSEVSVIDPYALIETLPMPSTLPTSPPPKFMESLKYLVPSGNDELFLVESILVYGFEVLDLGDLCRVSRLDEDIGEWVEVTDLGDRVLLLGRLGNISCSAKELPAGCSASGNSFLFTDEFKYRQPYFHRHGVITGNAGNTPDNLNFWRYSRKTQPPVTILNTLSMVAFGIKRSKP